ncbi:hypothetical protein D2E26_1327 [Bifidobacterium dolichotidis]|uniref:Uncharacterized protein n=1 Tax=Bifidobacterium dolichotidis TaxID=2306976 RepID=A0A430FNX3_9BIFI|nr:YiiX/YebB-like N1pC/P60 family cysteine hydrolase [Bifidobacterium dolichotidis]RSX54527.1 hypothetical protein D2E26_1327 [Bifidobacterium dolichotidis]
MKCRKHYFQTTICTAAAVLMFAGANVAQADTTTSDNLTTDSPAVSAILNDMLQYMPNVSYDELEQSVAFESQASQMSPLDVAEAARQEMFANQMPVANSGAEQTANITPITPKYVGDLLWTPAHTLFVQHGHSAMYTAKDQIIESTPEAGVHLLTRKKMKVSKTAYNLKVNTTQTKRNAAVARSKKFVRRAYNYNFALNKDSNGSKMNCSQLVWAAYISSAAKIDLDGTGGPGVYPLDITASSYTSKYHTY